MSDEIQLIVGAINSLQGNAFKDYMLPIFLALMSGLLGGGVAYYTVRTQEVTKIELEKVRILNKTMLIAMQIRHELVGIKTNYYTLNSQDPISRIKAIPSMLINNKNITFDLSELAFIVKKGKNEPSSRWSQIEYIDTIFSNYHSLMKVWLERNKLYENLLTNSNDKGIGISHGICNETIIQLSDLTERCIHMTDDVLVEISCFLIGFSEIAKHKVNKKITKLYASPIQFILPDNTANTMAVDILSPIPEVDYYRLAELHQTSIELCQQRYRKIYM